MMNVFVMPAYETVELDRNSGMDDLRAIFPDATATELNFCIFSTSGTHGSYLTIEDVAESIDKGEPETLTVLIVQPRVVRMLYGDIAVGKDDIDFLMKLRASSKDAVLEWFE